MNTRGQSSKHISTKKNTGLRVNKILSCLTSRNATVNIHICIFNLTPTFNNKGIGMPLITSIMMNCYKK